MQESNDENKYDVLLYLYSVLKRLGCGDVDTFEQRIVSQKTQYFAQLFGVSLRYNYNLYLKGPYSPVLANDLFEIKKLVSEQKIKPMLNKFIPEDLEERFSDLKEYLKGVTPRQLEILATYHWLKKVAGYPVKTARAELIVLKGATEKELEFVENKINKYEEIKAGYN